jgi:hypothetical protein
MTVTGADFKACLKEGPRDEADRETFDRLSKTLRKPSDVRHRVSVE